MPLLPEVAESTPLVVADSVVERGTRQRLELRAARLPTGTWLPIPVEVVHGSKPGPRVFLSAAIHGDEINGVEIIRRVLDKLDPARLRGAIIAVPIVNVFGFVEQSRYLPDRRDLNRSFPGSKAGSLAARLAFLFMNEIVALCSYGIDLHTGSNHRTNLPQIRADLSNAESRRIAEAFAAPVIKHSQVRDGSLREAACARGIPTLVYEAGEPLRFDGASIELGTQGVLRVLSELGLRKPSKRKRPQPIEVQESSWVRAKRGGILRLACGIGQHVEQKQQLGVIADAFGDDAYTVRARQSGLVLGHTNNPLVNQGDAIIHIGQIVSS